VQTGPSRFSMTPFERPIKLERRQRSLALQLAEFQREIAALRIDIERLKRIFKLRSEFKDRRA
jgi:hypothetical protein